MGCRSNKKMLRKTYNKLKINTRSLPKQAKTTTTMKSNYTYNLMREAEIMGYGSIDWHGAYINCCKQKKELTQQIKDQQELISILLDQLESNDPYYKNFIEEEEKVKLYIQKHPQP